MEQWSEVEMDRSNGGGGGEMGREGEGVEEGRKGASEGARERERNGWEVFSPDPLSFSQASTFCFLTEQALLGILILTNRAEIPPLNHSRDQSRTDRMYNSPVECRDTGQ